MRLDTLNTWVSTAIVGCPKEVLSITLAVLRPTPGRDSSAFLSSGTLLANCSVRILHVAMMCDALLLNRPMVLIICFRPSSPRSNICCGELALLNSFAVTLFTARSVDCADSITAMSSSNGELKFSSDVGFGISFASRLNISWRFVLFIKLYS